MNQFQLILLIEKLCYFGIVAVYTLGALVIFTPTKPDPVPVGADKGGRA